MSQVSNPKPPYSTFNPAGSVCVITGGANGIGRSLAIHLASLGASHIVLVDLDFQSAQTVVDQDLPPNIGKAMKANCGNEREIRHVINKVEQECGPIDAFFSNAGKYLLIEDLQVLKLVVMMLTTRTSTHAGILSTGGLEVSEDEWKVIWDINVMQTLYVARHLMPRFEKRKKGLLVVTASAAGLLSMPGALPYAVTKHASVAMAEWLAFTYAKKGIQVACLCPQAVRTNMTAIGEKKDGGPAGLDGILEPLDVAKQTMDAIAKGNFLILPHKEVSLHMKRKANDYDRFLGAMGKIDSMFGEFRHVAPNSRL